MADRPSDSDLVAAALAGSQDAFGELVARYKDAVFGVAFHRLGKFEEARDAAQDTFLKAYQSLSSLRKPASFGHWLYRLADGTSLDAARRPRREVPLDGDEEADSQGPTPRQAAHEAAVSRHVREALQTLTEASRLAVILHYVNGYSHAEVAGFLGTTTGAVKTRLNRARMRLRKEMIEMVGKKIRKVSTVFHYVVTSPEGVLIRGTSDAESARSLVQRLRERGYRVTSVKANRERHTSASAQAKAEQARFQKGAKTLADLIFDQALKQGAAAIKIVHPSTPAPQLVTGSHLVNNVWHQLVSVPEYAWAPLCDQLAEMAGMQLREGAARQTGRIRFSSHGKDHDFRLLITPKTIRVDIAP
jgi:RNA polymerase sigma-70 factor (ECF subfamily)